MAADTRSTSVLVGVLFIALAGCTATGARPNPVNAIRHEVTQGGCSNAPPAASDGAVQALAVNGELWVLPPGPVPLKVAKEVKIVFRLTGAGPLTVVAEGPGGERRAPSEPLAEHAGSNFERPGDEWGAFFTLDRPGCWKLSLERGATSGSFLFLVEA